MDGSQPFGLDLAQVGEGFRGPGLRCVLKIPRGLTRAVFGSLGRNHVRILRLKFSVFSFWENRMISIMVKKLSIIKKNSAVKF
jgi:hypothetical protein